MFKAPFSFDGRIRRIEYFLSGIIGGIVSSIAWALGVGTFVLGAASGSAGGSVFGLLIGLAAMIASIWFSLAQGVKRLHDLNKSGWLILLCCVPIVGWIFALYMLFADGKIRWLKLYQPVGGILKTGRRIITLKTGKQSLPVLMYGGALSGICLILALHIALKETVPELMIKVWLPSTGKFVKMLSTSIRPTGIGKNQCFI